MIIIFTSSYSLWILQVALTLTMVYAQDDQSGFISIDCGIDPGTSYTDNKTGINYVSDAAFIDGGVREKILAEYNSEALDFQLTTLTSFPESRSSRNCYTLRPQQGKGNRYLIRARFTYGNYDFKGQPPEFDLYLGSDYWRTVNFSSSWAVNYEILHLTSSDLIHVCLVNTGLGNPFISALELRLLDSTMYATQLESLILHARYNPGTSERLRYGDDKYDRIWYPLATSNTIDVKTSGIVSLGPEQVPSKVMSDAITITSTSITDELFYWWNADTTSQILCMYIYFAEIETLNSNQTREFNIYLNGIYLGGPVSPLNHITTTFFRRKNLNSSKYNVTMRKTENSILPPIFNAIELYMPKQLLQQQTNDQDAAAMWSTKSTYGLKRNWQGDPCVPKASLWDGLNCNYNDPQTPRIISLNLSSIGLSGEIAAALANLTMIQTLDLSYNNLTGSVPTFLASLEFLSILDLTGNNFAKPLPAELLAKSKSGSLLLSIEDNGSCPKGSCKNKKLNKVVIPVIATAIAIFVLLTLAIVWKIKRRRTQDVAKIEEPIAKIEEPIAKIEEPIAIIEEAIGIIEERIDQSRIPSFTYSDLKKMTDGFRTLLGEGGFGKVYQGLFRDKQVAVKMLSESSGQGPKEFENEISLLRSVNHKNIMSLVGYCDEGSHKGIIYEYMANGNLENHLFDRRLKVLSWETRLQIGYEAALGLEYMHHGCKPPIVHRDVKCSNILLDEKFQAKLADFGLSKAFIIEGATHASTIHIAGTPGYLDPEYHKTNRLTKKSDVYSFGIVLLEMITGRPATSKRTDIVNWVNSKVAEESVKSIIDPRLQECFDIYTAMQLVELAMTCVDLESVKRPTMNDVVRNLEKCLKGKKKSD